MLAGLFERELVSAGARQGDLALATGDGQRIAMRRPRKVSDIVVELGRGAGLETKRQGLFGHLLCDGGFEAGLELGAIEAAADEHEVVHSRSGAPGPVGL